MAIKNSVSNDQKSLETEFLIAICRQLGDKWQSKTLFLTIFYLRSSIVLTFSIAAVPVCVLSCVMVLVEDDGKPQGLLMFVIWLVSL